MSSVSPAMAVLFYLFKKKQTLIQIKRLMNDKLTTTKNPSVMSCGFGLSFWFRFRNLWKSEIPHLAGISIYHYLFMECIYHVDAPPPPFLKRDIVIELPPSPVI